MGLVPDVRPSESQFVSSISSRSDDHLAATSVVLETQLGRSEMVDHSSPPSNATLIDCNMINTEDDPTGPSKLTFFDVKRGGLT